MSYVTICESAFKQEVQIAIRPSLCGWQEKGNYTAKEAEMQKDYQDTLKAALTKKKGRTKPAGVVVPVLGVLLGVLAPVLPWP